VETPTWRATCLMLTMFAEDYHCRAGAWLMRPMAAIGYIPPIASWSFPP
jgi:hypothetical protein